MVSNLRGAANSEAGADLQTVMNGLTSLRDDIAALTKQVSNKAFDAGNDTAE